MRKFFEHYGSWFLPGAGLLLFWAIFVKTGLLGMLPLWYWKLKLKPLPSVWMIIPAGTILWGSIRWVHRHPKFSVINVAILIVAGAVLQLAFGLTEGRGLLGIQDRMIVTGHAIFAKDAFGPNACSGLIGRYQTLLDKGQLPEYPYSTKPPGHFSFYIATRKLASLFTFLGEKDTFEGMTRFASFFYPILTYLSLIPLFFISRRLLGQKECYWPLFLFLAVPNIVLVTLHLDQCLFPFVFMTSIALYLFGSLDGRRLLLLLSGSLAYLAFFLSFGMIALPVYLFVLTILLAVMNPETIIAHSGIVSRLRRRAADLVLCAAGFAMLHGLFLSVFNYNCIIAYERAMSMHVIWKVTDLTMARTLYCGVLDIFETMVWIGIPLSFLFVFGLFGVLRNGLARPVSLHTVVALSTVAIILLLAFGGRTASEVARLWIFMVPLLTLGAGSFLFKLFPRRPIWGLAWIMGLQFLSILMIKRYFDFY
jgi:hypothetical protein